MTLCTMFLKVLFFFATKVQKFCFCLQSYFVNFGDHSYYWGGPYTGTRIFVWGDHSREVYEHAKNSNFAGGVYPYEGVPILPHKSVTRFFFLYFFLFIFLIN